MTSTMLSKSWLGKGKNGGGGYRKDRPPEDDCCPICFDDFHVPCRTNCGHWFCGSCLLRFSRFMAKFRRCKCPMCGSLLNNLVPHTPVLIQPGREEVGEILGDIHQYNRENKVGRLSFTSSWHVLERIFMKYVGLLRLVGAIQVLVPFVCAIYDFCLRPNWIFPFGCALIILPIWLIIRSMNLRNQ